MNHWQNLSLKNIRGEKWKPIKGYEGLYEVSNMGRIKSLERNPKVEGYGLYHRDAIIKKQNFGTNKYLCVVLTNEGIKKPISIHRTVAAHFIKNHKNKKCVNHKKGIKIDNRASELEWATHSENMFHAFKFGLLVNKKGGDIKNAKKIKQLDLSGNLISVHTSIAEAAKSINISQGSISGVCRGAKYNKTAGGYKWQYA